MQGRFLEGVKNIEDTKSLKSAGLPNITGIFSGDDYTRSGAFYRYHTGSGHYMVAGAGLGDTYGFDASRCSKIYRNDVTTVQPASYTVVYIMKVR